LLDRLVLVWFELSVVVCMGAKVVQYLTSGLYRTHLWPPGGFAPHIHVLYREVPFILNITPLALRVFARQWFLTGVHGLWLKLGRVVSSGTVRGRTPSIEAPRLQGCRR